MTHSSNTTLEMLERVAADMAIRRQRPTPQPFRQTFSQGLRGAAFGVAQSLADLPLAAVEAIERFGPGGVGGTAPVPATKKLTQTAEQQLMRLFGRPDPLSVGGTAQMATLFGLGLLVPGPSGEARALKIAKEANRRLLISRRLADIAEEFLPDEVFLHANKYVATGDIKAAEAAAKAIDTTPGLRQRFTKELRSIFGDEITVYRGGPASTGPQSWTTDKERALFFQRAFSRGGKGEGRPLLQGTVSPEDVLFVGSADDAELVINTSKVRIQP